MNIFVKQFKLKLLGFHSVKFFETENANVNLIKAVRINPCISAFSSLTYPYKLLPYGFSK